MHAGPVGRMRPTAGGHMCPPEHPDHLTEPACRCP